MMIKRCLSYFGLALAFLIAPFSAQASERVVYALASVADFIQPYGAESAKHEATMASWRQGSQDEHDGLASNLIALSNHFGLASAAPFGVPDWDASTTKA